MNDFIIYEVEALIYNRVFYLEVAIRNGTPEWLKKRIIDSEVKKFLSDNTEIVYCTEKGDF